MGAIGYKSSHEESSGPHPLSSLLEIPTALGLTVEEIQRPRGDLQ